MRAEGIVHDGTQFADMIRSWSHFVNELSFFRGKRAYEHIADLICLFQAF
jgi:hypothetical protein